MVRLRATSGTELFSAGLMRLYPESVSVGSVMVNRCTAWTTSMPRILSCFPGRQIVSSHHLMACQIDTGAGSVLASAIGSKRSSSFDTASRFSHRTVPPTDSSGPPDHALDARRWSPVVDYK